MVDSYFNHLLSKIGDQKLKQTIHTILTNSNTKLSIKWNGRIRKKKSKTQQFSHIKQSETPSISRSKFFQQQKLKTQQAFQKTKKWAKQQKQIEKNKQKQQIENKKAWQTQKQKLLQLKQKSLNKSLIQKQKKLQYLKQKRLQRKLSLSKVKHQPSKHLKQLPLFVKLSNKYSKQVEIPALQKSQSLIQKKKLLRSSLNSQQIKKHQEWYFSVKSELNQRLKRNQSQKLLQNKISALGRSTSKLGASIVKLDQQKAGQQQKRRQKRLELLQKQHQYSTIVKQFYSPPHKPKEVKPNTISPLDVRKKSISEWKPRKFPVNSMIPVIPPKKESVVTDYLAQRRNLKHQAPKFKTVLQIDSSRSINSQIQIVQNNSKLLENESRKRELKLHPNKLKSIKVQQSADALLIASIKNKLSFLNKLRSD